MNTQIVNMDPYVYPETNVLRNLRGIRDPALLARFEMDMSSRRLTELAESSKAKLFDPSHVRGIHHYIFQDVYSWAGEFRTVNIARSGQYYFAFVERIAAALDETLRHLSKKRYLSDKSSAEFCVRAGHYLGEINAIHPFRDGNGRTQREFIRQLAIRNGYQLAWSGVTREQMAAASQLSFLKGDNSALAGLIQVALSGRYAV